MRQKQLTPDQRKKRNAKNAIAVIAFIIVSGLIVLYISSMRHSAVKLK